MRIECTREHILITGCSSRDDKYKGNNGRDTPPTPVTSGVGGAFGGVQVCLRPCHPLQAQTYLHIHTNIHTCAQGCHSSSPFYIDSSVAERCMLLHSVPCPSVNIRDENSTLKLIMNGYALASILEGNKHVEIRSSAYVASVAESGRQITRVQMYLGYIEKSVRPCLTIECLGLRYFRNGDAVMHVRYPRLDVDVSAHATCILIKLGSIISFYNPTHRQLCKSARKSKPLVI